MASTRRLPLKRWLAVGGTLVVEWMAVSIVFDAEPLGQWWQGLGYLGLAGPLILTVTIALVGLGGRALTDALAEGEQPHSRARLIVLVAAHIVSSAVAVALLADLTTRTEMPGTLLLVGLVAAAFVSAGSLSAIAIPPRAVASLWRRGGKMLSIAVGVGVFAFVAGLATEQAWDALAGATLELVVRMLWLITDDVVHVPAQRIVGTETFWVVIAPVCSGYEGIGLIVVFVSGYLWVERAALRFPQALWLLPIAVAVVWVANSVRITALIAVGTWLDPYIALDAFHSKAGWLLFATIALGLVWMSRRWSWLSSAGSDAAATENPTAAFVVPLLAVLATGLVTTAFATGVDLLYPLRIAAGVIALLLFRSRLARYLSEHEEPDERKAGEADRAPARLVDPVAIGLGALVGVVWIAMAPAATADAGALDDLSEPARAAWMLVRVAGSVLVIPVVEELAFRGYLLRRVFDPDFTRVSPGRVGWASLLVSSVAFGALHQSLLLGTAAGMVFALAQYRRGRVADAISAHAVANLCVAAFVLFTGSDGLAS